jgi:hypothetical protein
MTRTLTPHIISHATVKQKRIAELIIANSMLDKPLNGGQMLEKVGYSKGLQKYPSRILESEGVQQELEVAGFTERNAKQVVVEIMQNKEADNSSRLKATDQVFKVFGAYENENKNINILVPVLVKFMDKNERDSNINTN